MNDGLDLRCDPDDPAGLRAEIARRDKMIVALMNQVQRNLNSPDSDFALLHTTFMLEEQVRHRTMELEQAQRDIEGARDRLSAAIDSISEGFALFDGEDRLLICNEVYLSLWGLGRNAIGRTLEDLLRHPDRAMTPMMIERRLANHRAASGTSEYRLPGGRCIQVRERRTADGCTVGIYADITELAAAQAQKLRDAVDNIDQGLCMFDADLQLVLWNRRFLELTGLNRDFVREGVSLEAIFRANAEAGEYGDGDVDAMVAERMVLARQRVPHRLHRRRPNGTVLEINGRPLLDGGFVSTYTDITERIADEKAMREKTDQLIQSNSDLEQFAYVASHDLRTPLRNIVSYSQLLQRRYRGALDADADEFIGFIIDSATHMSRLLSDLLDYSLAVGWNLPLQPVSAQPAVQAALLDLKPDWAAAGAEVILGELPMVVADPSHLITLFQHLLGNGLKYRAPDRKPHLSVGAERIAPEQWRFAITDNGIGIERQYFAKIFEIFQRLYPAPGIEGTGIGLTLCRRIVHRFGGTIWVESEFGVGTTFFFTLKDPGTPRD